MTVYYSTNHQVPEVDLAHALLQGQAGDRGLYMPRPIPTMTPDLLKQARDLGSRVVSFGGGEPLMRPDLLDLLEASNKLGLDTHINTNGTLITPEIAGRLGNLGLRLASISIDGPDAKTHEQIRGDGTFMMATAAVRHLKQHAPGTAIC